MARRVSLRARMRYWFDNTVSRGTTGLIGWLAAASLGLVLVVTVAIEIVDPTGERRPAAAAVEDVRHHLQPVRADR